MVVTESERVQPLTTLICYRQVLCLQLKRFTYVAHGTHTRHEKLTRAVNFPLRGMCIRIGSSMQSIGHRCRLLFEVSTMTLYLSTSISLSAYTSMDHTPKPCINASQPTIARAGLNVSKYCLDDTCSDSDAVYDLVAVCNHFGSVENGHYTADVLSAEDQRWYNCNDSKVPIQSTQGQRYVVFLGGMLREMLFQEISPSMACAFCTNECACTRIIESCASSNFGVYFCPGHPQSRFYKSGREHALAGSRTHPRYFSALLLFVLIILIIIFYGGCALFLGSNHVLKRSLNRLNLTQASHAPDGIRCVYFVLFAAQHQQGCADPSRQIGPS